MSTPTLTGCIVTYKSPIAKVVRAVESVLACRLPIRLVIVDNNSGTGYVSALKAALPSGTEVIESGKNGGFGFGHNVGFEWFNSAHNRHPEGAQATEGSQANSTSPHPSPPPKGEGTDCAYHLIINPDIIVQDGAIETMVAYMDAHADIGLLAPKIVDEYGVLQYLCKSHPTVLALFGRRFLPAAVQKLPFIQSRLDAYAMKDADYHDVLEPEFISGCFMLFRTATYRALSGFDERYFLYFEDTDITQRTKRIARAVYMPEASVTHDWAGGARSSWKLTKIMLRSAFQYFNQWGWRWW